MSPLREQSLVTDGGRCRGSRSTSLLSSSFAKVCAREGASNRDFCSCGGVPNCGLACAAYQFINASGSDACELEDEVVDTLSSLPRNWGSSSRLFPPGALDLYLGNGLI